MLHDARVSLPLPLPVYMSKTDGVSHAERSYDNSSARSSFPFLLGYSMPSFFLLCCSLSDPFPQDLSGIVKPARGQWCGPRRHSSRGSSRYIANPPRQGLTAHGRTRHCNIQYNLLDYMSQFKCRLYKACTLLTKSQEIQKTRGHGP